MTSPSEIRQTFLRFFQEKSHTLVASAPIVIKNDPTLMFTNAGMNQFKDCFLGNGNPIAPRVADTQKCLRVSGKHNDLEEVGVDTYHHTMFEMLGNWSFGNYFKKEAIEWAWELLTTHYKLDPGKLYITVFEGDKSEQLPPDYESLEEWKKWVSEDRIIWGSKKDNFWEMGETGPCGPCSEIHIDLRSPDELAQSPGRDWVNKDHPQVIEIWNLVFMEFNRKADGTLESLPQKHVDTGMGFERLVRAIEKKSSNYDTEVFRPYISFLEKETHIPYTFSDNKSDIAMRVIADHIRAISFAIVDGQLPSNTGAGYVIRRILRRAVRYYFSFLNNKEPLLYKLLPVLITSFQDIFPELKEKESFIKNVILEEEKLFLRTLSTGLQLLGDFISDGKIPGSLEMALPENSRSSTVAGHPKTVPGEFAFLLNDTFGFPIDLTALISKENGINVDMNGYHEQLAMQKQRSRQDAKTETDDWQIIIPDEHINFCGYDVMECETRITRYRNIVKKNNSLFQVLLENTPFYAESGGQVGDTGTLENENEKINILDTKKENNLIVHIVEKLPRYPDAVFKAIVNTEKRKNTERNHSATHLLHAALREVLGVHVEQKGSLVNEGYLRFDFSHFKAMTSHELHEVEDRVNFYIRENLPKTEKRNVPLEEARNMGAMALFGEKYGDEVRVISFGNKISVELCGGTHVPASGHIGTFIVLSESAVAAGIRRIEAITGEKALQYIYQNREVMQQLKDILKSKDILKGVQQLQEEKQLLEAKMTEWSEEKTAELKQQLLSKVKIINGVNVISEVVDIQSTDQLKNLSFQLRSALNPAYIILGATIQQKAQLSLIISDELVQKNQWDARKIIKDAASIIKGGGGGQPFYATAGGSDISRLEEAVKNAVTLL